MTLMHTVEWTAAFQTHERHVIRSPWTDGEIICNEYARSASEAPTVMFPNFQNVLPAAGNRLSSAIFSGRLLPLMHVAIKFPNPESCVTWNVVPLTVGRSATRRGDSGELGRWQSRRNARANSSASSDGMPRIPAR